MATPVTTMLTTTAKETDARVAAARADLVQAVRQAAAQGMTQTQIAAAIGRSQPEVSRLLRFHGITSSAMRLRRKRAEIIGQVKAAGGSNVRVFGSVASGRDHEQSDIDLLFTMRRPLSLMQLGALEQRLADLVGVSVDLVPDTAIRPALRDRILAEAVRL